MLFRHIALIYENALPLSALCLVTGNGIGILHLQSVVIGIFLNLPAPLLPVGYLRIIIPHVLEKSFLSLSGKGRGFAPKRIQQNNGIKFQVVVIGKLQCSVGKTEPVKRALVPEADRGKEGKRKVRKRRI